MHRAAAALPPLAQTAYASTYVSALRPRRSSAAAAASIADAVATAAVVLLLHNHQPGAAGSGLAQAASSCSADCYRLRVRHRPNMRGGPRTRSHNNGDEQAVFSAFNAVVARCVAAS